MIQEIVIGTFIMLLMALFIVFFVLYYQRKQNEQHLRVQEMENAFQKKLLEVSVSATPDDEEEDAEHPRDITGIHFAINGQLSLKQDVVKTAIEKAGGVVCSQLTKKVNVLVTNGDASAAKYDKARSAGIKIVTEDYLTHILAPYRD